MNTKRSLFPAIFALAIPMFGLLAGSGCGGATVGTSVLTAGFKVVLDSPTGTYDNSCIAAGPQNHVAVISQHGWSGTINVTVKDEAPAVEGGNMIHSITNSMFSITPAASGESTLTWECSSPPPGSFNSIVTITGTPAGGGPALTATVTVRVNG